MEDVVERAQDLVASYDALVQEELPAGVEIFDAHVHLGTDIDGMQGDLEELLRIQRAHGITRSFMFCLDEPDRHPGFRAPNDRTLAFAEQSGGELVPFVRLDLAEGPIEEATRCLDLGAGGIKLQPRAQKFMLDDERLAPVFELAAERKVPILIHGGRGLPPIADALARLMDAYEPQLIVAHAGIADLAALASHFSGRPGVFFDTSVWSPLDLLDLYRLVAPE
ncbi:MAG: amidohydrolase family protein, partial [Thermoleophilia bacterium]|nr:amidohydrolase family protein [Thermoleophilia bacterium]